MRLTHVTYFIAKSALFGSATFALIATTPGMSPSARSLSANRIQYDAISPITTIATEFEPPPERGEPDGTVGLGLG